MSLKSYVFPSVLQKEAIPVIKAKAKSNNVIVRYSSMSGIKLTVLLPLINQHVREVASNPTGDPKALVILCHSSMRCTEIEGFLKEVLNFCKDVVEVIDLYNGDKQENILHLKQAFTGKASYNDPREQIKSRCKILIATPIQYLDILK
jgi:superfamily II DNA/RNA helicase